MTKIRLVAVLSAFVLLCILSVGLSFSASVEPYSYRHDEYVIPPYNEVQDKALLKFDLNMEIPRLTVGQPLVIVDGDGNKSFYVKGKIVGSISDDGVVTHYNNQVKQYSEKILLNGGVAYYRTYERVSKNIIKTLNEFNEPVSWEVLGYNDKVVERYDSNHFLVSRLEYDGGYWEEDLVNKVWKKIAYGLPQEERLGKKSGPVIALWERGGYFGREGVWRVEKEWDGEKGEVATMYYSLYNGRGTQKKERYNVHGGVVERNEYSRGLSLEEGISDHTYRKYGDYGWSDEGTLAYGNHVANWNAEYNGSKRVKATRTYEDLPFYDERVYHGASGDLDIVVRKDNTTGDVLAVLEDRIYFWEVENKSETELSEYFNVSMECAGKLFQWIELMKAKNKSSASLFAILNDMDKRQLTVYEEYNKPSYTISLLNYT